MAVKSIEETVNVVALFVAFSVSKHLPALDGSRAIHPGIDSKRAVSTIKVARIGVAFLITVAVPSLLFTAPRTTQFLFLFK